MMISPKDEAAKVEEKEQNEEKSSESESESNKIVPFSPRAARLREKLLSKIVLVPWEEVTVSLDNFPYYIEEDKKTLLVECVASHLNLKQSKLRKYGARLKSSSRRILLQTVPGTELYRERLVSALAREMQVPLLKFDDDDEDEDDSDEDEDSADEKDDKVNDKAPKLKEGDRVKYIGNTISVEKANNRTLSKGQRGEVHEVKGERVAVVFNICGLKTKEGEKDEKNTEISGQALLTWLDVKDVEQENDAETYNCHIGIEVLYEVLESRKTPLVYFPSTFSFDFDDKPLMRKSKRMFDQLPEGVVIICAENNWDAGLENREEFPVPLKDYIERLEVSRTYGESEAQRLFPNVVCIKPPMDEDLVKTFVKQIEEDRLTWISEGNLKTIHKVLKDHNLSCTNLENPNVEDMILTREKVEMIVGWATNHYLSSCPTHSVNEEVLQIPHESIKLAISRFMDEEKHKKSEEQPKGFQDLASGCHEKSLTSAVIRSEDIGVKFDDVGALENVKKLLHETVILPMRRPELFSHGNLLKPCRGILLFGPPGTGKTLMAKALATESGANFINITVASITSMWVGETEHLTRALFSYATKLAPVIIFIDEVDSLLGARGNCRHDTSRLNEFMAAWDGLTSKDSQRILVVGATNRPFDLDEAVIRRMPRRIYVGLPDVENRSKILKIILNKENLEPEFSFEQLAEATEGYSGSDLKNLCVAAAYRPVEEFLERESKGEASDGAPALRPLNLYDFIHSKSKVRASVAENASSIIKLRQWREKYGERESQDESSTIHTHNKREITAICSDYVRNDIESNGEEGMKQKEGREEGSTRKKTKLK